MYRIAICDDDREFHNKVIEKVLALNMVTDKINFVQFNLGEELLKSDMEFDLLFLDIKMSGINGNEALIIFRQRNDKCVFIFCTSYQQPLTDNFKVLPFRYIMKDLHYRDLSNGLPASVL